MNGNGITGSSTSGSPLYTVKWPRASTHTTRSVSGVLVESNVRGYSFRHGVTE